jgi:hypothetical protein
MRDSDSDPALIDAQRKELVIRERRAFARGFWAGGALATLPFLGISLTEIWSDSLFTTQWIVAERILYSLLVILVGGAFGVLLFGIGPGFGCLIWANLFPESIVGRPFGSRLSERRSNP